VLVEGGQAAGEGLAARLAPYGGDFPLARAFSGAEALTLTGARTCAAMLLDAQLADMPGSALCRLLRRHGFGAPILLLGMRSAAEADIIEGLESGADDYLARPFALPVLIARLRAQLRERAAMGAAMHAVGPYLFQPATRQLVERATGRKIRLTAKEAAMLRYLQAYPGRPVSRQSLMRQVWGYSSAAASHTLETHVYRLRRKLEGAPGFAMLESVPGGYRLAVQAA
jgi:DNA-binding response OmpR family regulator